VIAELGHVILILALAVAVVQTVFPLWGATQQRLQWMLLARSAARLQCALLLLSFLLLVSLFLNNDFSVAYVANNSNSKLPWFYKVSAVWGAHEGSLLLWTLILGMWSAAVSLFSRRLPLVFVARVLGVMGLVSVGFLLFMIFTSNPFDRMFPVPPDGADLNPLLQDPGLIFHPPLLYMGYVGFSVAFGFAIAALLGGQLDSTWARWSRPWTLMAWTFLTIGIALGSWWAYYELGWGGWWFWDPVENASFMPWLIGTALIHSLAATEKREVFKNWTLLLAICAFGLSLLGTFLVRSGVLTSVHAFATDPTRGVFILALLVFFIGGSLLLYAWRAPQTLNVGKFDLLSRETFLLLNSVLMLVAMLTVLLGTLYPLFIEALGMGKLSVGPPYFNLVFIPVVMPVFLFLGIGIHTRWKKDDIRRLRNLLVPLLLSSLVLALLITVAMVDKEYVYTFTGIAAALWITLSTGLSLVQRYRHRASLVNAITTTPAGFYGMNLAHLGMAIAIVGVTATSLHDVDLHTRIGAGQHIDFAGYEFHLETLREVPGPNYRATEAVVRVTRDGKPVTTLRSQKRLYEVRGMPMTEAGIDSGLTRDLYISLGEPVGDGDWSMRIYHKPFVNWIWLGALFMGAGGLLAAMDRRYRLKQPATSEARLSALQSALARGKSV